MHLKGKAVAVFGALFVAACGGGSDSQEPGVGTVSGRLQSAGSADSAAQARVYAVDDEGELSLAGEGAVAADGRFEVSEVPSGPGPFIVRIEGSGTVAAEVIVPGAIGSGDEVTTIPVGGETTLEAEALVSILAGSAGIADVDSVGLMTWIDARLAAGAEGSAAALGAAFMSAQGAWLEVAASANSHISAGALEQAELDAWGELAVTLDAATSAAAEADAWGDFMTQVAADVRSTLSIDLGAQADATAAAGFLFGASLSGSSALHEEALRVAAVLSAHADFAAQLAASAGSSAAASVEAELDAAYSAFFEAAAEADSAAELSDAWLDLTTQVTGSGSVSADSALGLLASAEGGADAVAQAGAAIAASAEAAAQLETQLSTALAGSSEARIEAVAQAYIAFRSQVAAAIAAEGGLSARLEAFVTESAAQIGGHTSLLLDLDVGAILEGFVGSVVETGISISGDAVAEVLIGATTAVLVQVDAGSIVTLATGEIEGDGFVFSGIEATGTLVVELRDAAGDVTGAVLVQGALGGDLSTSLMTVETTAEALVLIDLAAAGESPEAVDMLQLQTFIDATVAAATETEGDVHGLALALSAAAAVMAQAQGGSAQAQAEAAVTFAAVIDAVADGELALAAEARAQIEGAVALESAVIASFNGSGLAAHSAEVTAAVDVFIAAAGQVTSQGELDAAADAFVDTLLAIDFSGGSSLVQVTLQGILSTSFAAGATFQSTVEAAVGAGLHGGVIDAEGVAQAVINAGAVFQGGIDLSALLWQSGESQAMTTLVAHLAMSFHGGFDGTFAP